MAAINYTIAVRDSSVATGDNRKTGLTPAWIFLKTLATGSTVSTPTISEIGYGQYAFAFDAETNGECAGQIDAGSSLSVGSDRFIDILLTRDSSRIQSAINASGIAAANTQQFAGHAVQLDSNNLPLVDAATVAAGTGPIAINQNTGGSDNLRYVNADSSPVAGAAIMIYLATDWPANPQNIVARATTGSDGRWLAPAFVASGAYVAVFTKPGADGPDVSSPFSV